MPGKCADVPGAILDMVVSKKGKKKRTLLRIPSERQTFLFFFINGDFCCKYKFILNC